MVYNSLIDAPRNLKEGIDWLIALKGTNAAKSLTAMGAAIHKFLADKPAGFTEVPALEKIKSISKKFLEQDGMKYEWCVERLLGRFKEPMKKQPSLFDKWFGIIAESDYENVVQKHGVDTGAMTANLTQVVDNCEKFLGGIKDADQYKSAYSSEATWEASCAKNPEACAVVLVGVAPILYTGLRSLWAATESATKRWPPYYAKQRLANILQASGYVEPEFYGSVSGSDLLNVFKGMDVEIFTTLYDFAGYWAFYGERSAGAVGPAKSAAPEQPAAAEQSSGADEPEGGAAEGDESEEGEESEEADEQ
ncbi:hypothetical protein, conserved [Babesia ovata]|uniref:Uncharacterized protein n=1 Tax=Babesia ovata TaxID=189622 RepID=A0A2H6K7W7_9APIC|nr:uncharacterized protein BOVATA_005420 [Babesia ovata]GBE59049.1 hypothetical protein, conserved [Babesia ovata]